MAFLEWLHGSGFAVWIRESGSLWAYPTILFLHTLGLAILVGFNAAFDLRVLGVAPRVPLTALEGLFPLMWVGFWINALSGVALFIADAPDKARNPMFPIKLVLIALAIVMLVSIRRAALRPERTTDAQAAKTKTFAAISLVLWIGATTAGRWMAYWKTFESP
jgi:hypothetical protein